MLISTLGIELEPTVITLTGSSTAPLPAEALRESSDLGVHSAPRFVSTLGTPIALLGVPFDNVTTAETIALVERMVASRRPHYLATANVDFLVQALHDVELRRILFEAHLVLCDGTPLVWASRWLGNPLSERVAGSDLVPLLVRLAAQKGYRLFFLGGSPESTVQAVQKLQVQYPNLIIAGHYSPPFQDLLAMNHEELKQRVQAARPDMLFVSFGCPKQEKWIAMHYRSLQVPVSIGVGATIDFLAGRLARAPRWMQQTGTEWIFRLVQEPRRLFKRYARDCWYFGGLLAAQLYRMRFRSRRGSALSGRTVVQQTPSLQELQLPDWLDAEAVHRDSGLWEKTLQEPGHLLLNLANVRFIDSTGVGLLIRLRKRASLQNRHVILLSPSTAVQRALQGMRLWPFFLTAQNVTDASTKLNELTAPQPVTLKLGETEPSQRIQWQGEITAVNADEVWKATEAYLNRPLGTEQNFVIDLSGVSFVDSTGVGLMVRAKKHALKHGVRLAFVEPQANVLNVVRLSKLETYLLSGT